MNIMFMNIMFNYFHEYYVRLYINFKQYLCIIFMVIMLMNIFSYFDKNDYYKTNFTVINGF